MGLKLNPLTAQFDLTGSGGGQSYIDGEVATYNDLPLSGTTAPLDSAWLVRGSSGIWPFTKPGGVYIRTATGGSSRDADYTYAGVFPDVFSDAQFTLYDDADTSKNLKFQLSGISTGTTRTLTVPDGSGTIQLALVRSSSSMSSNVSLSAGRARHITYTLLGGSYQVTLPLTGNQSGDVCRFTNSTSSSSGAILTVARGNGSGGTVLITTLERNQTVTCFNRDGTETGWTLEGVDTHAHAAADVTSGVFDNARVNFAAPSAIGSTTASSGAFTTLSASGTVSGTGFSNYLASPPAIGGTSAAAGTFTTLTASTSLTLGTSGILSGGTNTIEQRNTTSAQTFRIYNTVSGTADANYERGFIRWNASVLEIGTEKLGTGSARELAFFTDGTRRGRFNASGSFITDGNIFGGGYIQLTSGNSYRTSGRWRITSDATSGRLIVTTDADLVSGAADFGTLCFGGTTTAFPALKRSSTALQVRLADDSAFAPLEASTFSNYNSFTDSNNFERGFFRWNSNTLLIGTEKLGTGSARNLQFLTDNTARITIDTSGNVGINVSTPERPFHISGSSMWARFDRVGSVGPAIMMVRQATLGSTNSSWLLGSPNAAGVSNEDFALIDYGVNISGTVGTPRLTIAKSDGQLTVNGNLNLSTKDLVTDTTTGTKIGTGTTQKLGFFNATPIVRPAAIADATDAATTQARLNDLLAAMRSLGLIAT